MSEKERARHWRKQLKNGNVQFFFDTGTSYGSVKGSASDQSMVDYLVGELAEQAGVEVPKVEWREAA